MASQTEKSANVSNGFSFKIVQITNEKNLSKKISILELKNSVMKYAINEKGWLISARHA